MRIIDTYYEIINFINDGTFTIENWKKYVSQISNELPNKILDDIASYDFEQEVLPVISNVYESLGQMEKAHQSFLTVTKDLEQTLIEQLGIDIEVDVILYLGLCSGAGWATTLYGRKVVLLGIEKIVELNWTSEIDMKGLVYHELGHIWHDTVGIVERECSTQQEKSIWQLFIEGVAMYFEQLICRDMNFYHQDQKGWLNWCDSHKEELLHEFTRRVNHHESTQDFFGDWCNYKGYSDCGYYLGCLFVHSLIRHYSLYEIGQFDLEKVVDEFYNFNL